MTIQQEIEKEVLRLCSLVQQGDLSALWSLHDYVQSLSNITDSSEILEAAQQLLSLYPNHIHS